MGSEFKAIIMSTWKIPCTLPGIVPYVFSLLFFVLFITSQVVPNFNTFQLFPCFLLFCSLQCRWSIRSKHFNLFLLGFFLVLFFTMKVVQYIQYILFLCPCKYWLGRMLNAHLCLCVTCFPPHGVSSFDILLY